MKRMAEDKESPAPKRSKPNSSTPIRTPLLAGEKKFASIRESLTNGRNSDDSSGKIKRHLEQKGSSNIVTVEAEKNGDNCGSVPTSDLKQSMFQLDESLLEVFHDDDIFDECSTKLKGTETCKRNESDNKLLEIRRKVVDVSHDVDKNGFPMKVLRVKINDQEHNIELRDNWCELKVQQGDYVNVITNNNGTARNNQATIKVEMTKNLIVVHPDHLISGTTISNAFGCLRRAIISERFKGTEIVSVDDVSKVMLIGTLVHSLFQKSLDHDKALDRNQLLKLAHSIVFDRRYLQDILAVASSQEEIYEDVVKFLPHIQGWMDDHLRWRTTVGVGIVDMNLPTEHPPGNKTRKFKASVAMTQVMDIEENVWSPRYGLKGKIDVTGRFKIRESRTNDDVEVILPVEIKTGRASHSMEHHIQVATYSMFCNERRNSCHGNTNSLSSGLLVYLKSGKTSCVPLKQADRNGLIMLRNQVANYLVNCVNKAGNNATAVHCASFPPTITNENICKNCSHLRNCALMHKAVDGRESAFQPSPELLNLMSHHTSHLTEHDLQYFEHWMTCTLLENIEVRRKDSRLRFWLKTSKERSEDGSCITDLLLAGPLRKPTDQTKMLVTFKRSREDSTLHHKTQFEVDEMVLISGPEPEFVAMATAVIHKIHNNFITVETDRNFGTYDVTMKYSIDRHVWLSQISVQSALSNLSMLMDNYPQCNRLRGLIISHREPTFQRSLNFIPRSSKDEVAKMLQGLNRTQRQAIKRVLLSNDYTLVVGMPGSGKTTTIVAMIRILLLCGLRVLVTSYTHSAVDNLLMKLIKYQVGFLRLGRLSQVHPSVHPYTEETMSRDFTNPSQLNKLYNDAVSQLTSFYTVAMVMMSLFQRVVGCTCLAVTSHVFFAIPGKGRDLFDVCIVDEASQIAQPACISPLLCATKFVLVGDHKQLPPLVVSREAKEMGADESLFWRLTRHKAALCELTMQYRMNREIMTLSNHVTYEGRLECAHPSVGMATLRLDGDAMVEAENEWIARVVDPEHSVIFLDTSKTSSADEGEGVTWSKLEAKVARILVSFLIKAGCQGDHIGVIAPFRDQIKLLEQTIPDGVEVNTVDKYQGRDKNVIVVSFVKRGGDAVGEKKGELLSDWRRLNVALTRAKHKLVMVGCTTALRHYEPCKKLIDYLASRDKIWTL
ncbi:unnamed protein product [Clavelina lepadiformis]|uniref:DNA replication ATP-dependent helicase/nuclease n=1 Tax=Clavelina lepadiformis TaxID=159417 RepID=A0ABP0G7C9_CLALP